MQAKNTTTDDKPIDPCRLLIELLRIVDANWISPSQFERLLKDFEIEEGEHSIAFLTGVKRVLREMPEKIYSAEGIRGNVLNAVQDALDAAIEREEELDNPPPEEEKTK